MSQPVTIENDAIRMDVWPAIGGKVASVIDKADKYELMFTYPNEVPTAPRYDAPFDDSWCGGWDECFPAVAPGRYVGHPYDGISVPDHGELWGLPTVAVPTKDGITTVWHGLRFGYRLTRKLYLNANSLIAEYTLINLAPFEFRYVWSLHSLMSLHVPAELDLVKPTDFRYSHDGEGVDHQKPFTWPTMEDGDLSKPAHLPARKGWKVFSMSPIKDPMVVKVRYPSRAGDPCRSNTHPKKPPAPPPTGESGSTPAAGAVTNISPSNPPPADSTRSTGQYAIIRRVVFPDWDEANGPSAGRWRDGMGNSKGS